MNFGTPVPLLVGLILILGAVGLFFLDKLKPGYERSSDKVYSILLLLSGIFLLAHLNMELLASFQQVMLVGMLTTLIINDISKRDSNRTRSVEREGPPRRYDERPRRVYRAELDDWDSPGQRQPRIPSDRYGNDGYGERYEPRPIEPRPPYDDRRPPARLQPGQPGRDQFDSYSDRARPGDEPPRYNGPSRPQQPSQSPPQRPPRDTPVPAGNGAGHSLGGLPQPPRGNGPRNERPSRGEQPSRSEPPPFNEQRPPRDERPSRDERPPLNVRPRTAGQEGSYTEFRPAPSSDEQPPYPDDAPPPQPPANY